VDVLLEEGHCLRDHTLEACGRAQLASADGIEATSLLTLVEMVESGLGLALVPEIAIQGGLLATSDLVARPLASPAPKRTIALVARRSTARLAEFSALAEHIVEIRRARKGKVMTSIGRRA
jgi:LysR family transcriptional regulator, hydrogen peroxide-inducible genes activator